MKKILVVDDEPSITTLLKYNLEKENFEVDVCHDGEDAINKALINKYDFIIFTVKLFLMASAVCDSDASAMYPDEYFSLFERI